VSGGGGAVHRDLHAFDGKARQSLGGALVDAAAIGLDLEGDAARGEALEDLPAVRDAERLAAAEGDVGDAGMDDAARELECLFAVKLVAPGAVRTRLLAAGDAARAAAVGELPGKKKGRAKLVNRACIARPGIGVNCWTISGEADVRLSHHLLGNVLHPGRLPVQALDRLGLLGRFLLLFPQIRFSVTHALTPRGFGRARIQNSRIQRRRV